MLPCRNEIIPLRPSSFYSLFLLLLFLFAYDKIKKLLFAARSVLSIYRCWSCCFSTGGSTMQPSPPRKLLIKASVRQRARKCLDPGKSDVQRRREIWKRWRITTRIIPSSFLAAISISISTKKERERKKKEKQFHSKLCFLSVFVCSKFISFLFWYPLLFPFRSW